MTDLVVHPVLDLTAREGVVVGKHAAWIPPRGGHFGVKVPFQANARVQKYRHPHEASYDRGTVAEEIAMLRWLASQGYAPDIGRVVFYQTVISEHLGYLWADPLGAFGYEMRDADSLPPGPVTPAVVEQIRADGMIVGSDGAWNDLLLAERGNIRNGYVIDVRRSGFDLLRYRGEIDPLPEYREDSVALRDRLSREGQFPFGKRSQAYQEFYLDGEWNKAEREVVHRAEILGFDPKAGESVLDLGSCLGGFLAYAALKGAGPLVGVDGQPEFIDLARALARASGWNICYRDGDLRYDVDIANWIRTMFPNGVTHLLCLSMGKHLSVQVMWWYVDHLNAKKTYLETNAASPGEYPWSEEVKRRGGCYVGDTRDRNTRRVYVLSR